MREIHEEIKDVDKIKKGLRSIKGRNTRRSG